jgi:uncharacterized protein YndB with AHSA1/START domain
VIVPDLNGLLRPHGLCTNQLPHCPAPDAGSIVDTVALLKGSATTTVSAAPDDVFATITDLSRLSEWNPVIKETVESPTALDPGSEWLVRCQAVGAMKWNSRSRCEELLLTERKFMHRSCTDDGNPSYAIWTWQVTPSDGGARVDVTWELHPVTFWRRLLMARIRHRMLRKEVSQSLALLVHLTAPG